MIWWGKNLGSKDERAPLLLGPLAKTGTDDCSVTLILIILSLEKISKCVG